MGGAADFPGNGIATWLRSEYLLDDSVPAGVQDAELHTYLKDGIALCKLLQTYKGGIRVHEQIKFKFHALDNLKAFANNVRSELPEGVPGFDPQDYYESKDTEWPKVLTILKHLADKRGVNTSSIAPSLAASSSPPAELARSPSPVEEPGVVDAPSQEAQNPAAVEEETVAPVSVMDVDGAGQGETLNSTNSQSSNPFGDESSHSFHSEPFAQPFAAEPVFTAPSLSSLPMPSPGPPPAVPARRDIVATQSAPGAGRPPVPARSANTENVVKASVAAPVRRPVPPIAAKVPEPVVTTNPFDMAPDAISLTPRTPSPVEAYTGPVPGLEPLIPVPVVLAPAPEVVQDSLHAGPSFGMDVDPKPSPMFTAGVLEDELNESNDEWFKSALRREFETVLVQLTSSQTVYVDWPNYPDQLVWDLRISPYPSLTLRYAISFHMDSPMSYQPKFTRLFDREQFAPDSDERYWQARVEKIIEEQRKPPIFQDMVTLVTVLDAQVHGPEGRGNLLRSRSLIGIPPPVPPPPVLASPLANFSPRPVPPPPMSSGPRGKLVGLQNGRGQNVCFMNCLMQVLSHVCYAGKMKILLDQIFTTQHMNLIRDQQGGRGSAVSNHQVAAVQALLSVLSSIYNRQEDKAHSSMLQLRKSLALIPASRVVAPDSPRKQEQQDVHELLVFLLELIERAAATPEPRHINFDLFDKVVRGGADLWEVMADLHWEERFSVGEQKVAAMFGHQSVTAYHCGCCAKIVQYRPEISTILNVPIGMSTADTSVQTLVDEVLGKETLSDWRCELCQQRSGETFRATRLGRLPAFLVVHLVRGVYSPQGELVRSKRKVALDNLQISILPRKDEAQQVATYVPHGMIIHHGNTMDSGHYTAYASVGEEIVFFDDTNHRIVGKQLGDKDMAVVRENVTLVFFVRQ